MPITMSRTTSDAVKCFSTWGVCGIISPATWEMAYPLFCFHGYGEVVPGGVEMENGGSSRPAGVGWIAFDQERRKRHEKKIHERELCWQGFGCSSGL
jgi:hypothetical protein